MGDILGMELSCSFALQEIAEGFQQKGIRGLPKLLLEEQGKVLS